MRKKRTSNFKRHWEDFKYGVMSFIVTFVIVFYMVLLAAAMILPNWYLGR